MRPESIEPHRRNGCTSWCIGTSPDLCASRNSAHSRAFPRNCAHRRAFHGWIVHPLAAAQRACVDCVANLCCGPPNVFTQRTATAGASCSRPAHPTRRLTFEDAGNLPRGAHTACDVCNLRRLGSNDRPLATHCTMHNLTHCRHTLSLLATALLAVSFEAPLSAQWTNVSPAAGPSGRRSHAMAYDSQRNVTVLFGGYSGGGPSGIRGDTWERDGTSWTQVASTGPRSDERRVGNEGRSRWSP